MISALSGHRWYVFEKHICMFHFVLTSCQQKISLCCGEETEILTLMMLHHAWLMDITLSLDNCQDLIMFVSNYTSSRWCCGYTKVVSTSRHQSCRLNMVTYWWLVLPTCKPSLKYVLLRQMQTIEVIKAAANENNIQTQSTHTIESKNHLTSKSNATITVVTFEGLYCETG